VTPISGRDEGPATGARTSGHQGQATIGKAQHKNKTLFDWGFGVDTYILNTKQITMVRMAINNNKKSTDNKC